MNANSNENENGDGEDDDEIRLFKRRWFILSMFMVYAVFAGMQWMQYSIISKIMKMYYNVELYVIEWTTMIHMLSYVIVIFPGLYLLERLGNRITMILASGGVMIGAWIKLYAAFHPETFAYVLLGQTIEASAQVLTFGLAGNITAAWFGPDEIALAGALALFGDQLGAGLGFVLPPLFVEESTNSEIIFNGLYNLNMLIVIMTTSVFVLILIYFNSAPITPPSSAQIMQHRTKQQNNTVKNYKRMLCSKSFILIFITYGIHIAVFNAHGTLLNRIFVWYFPGSEKHAGVIGSLIIFFGVFGAVLSSIYLDKKHLYKKTTLVLYICSTLSMLTYTFAYSISSIPMIYVIACIFGTFMFGYYSVGLQMAIEIVYPNSEGIAAGMMLFAVQVVSLIVLPIYRLILETYHPFGGNMFLVGLMIVGTILTVWMPDDHKRQDAERRRRKKLELQLQRQKEEAQRQKELEEYQLQRLNTEQEVS